MRGTVPGPSEAVVPTLPAVSSRCSVGTTNARGLAGAGFGARDQVAARQRQRNDRALNRAGLGEAEVAHPSSSRGSRSSDVNGTGVVSQATASSAGGRDVVGAECDGVCDRPTRAVRRPAGRRPRGGWCLSVVLEFKLFLASARGR